MTVEEKLKHFFDSSIDDAHTQSENAIKEYKEILEKDFADFKKDMDEHANAKIRLEENKIKSTLNHELSSSLLQTKKLLSDKHHELIEALSQEVLALLAEFKDTPEYNSMIINQVKDALAFAGDDSLTIYIDPADTTIYEKLNAEFDATFKISEYSFGGGIRAIVNDKGILIDNSFDTRFKEIMNGFSFSGGFDE